MNAIVVTFDRLPVGFLSCCGNSWIATPNFDRLAARSAVFEQHFAEGISPNSASQSWWSGRSPRLTARDGDTPSLPSLLSEHGVTVVVGTGAICAPCAVWRATVAAVKHRKRAVGVFAHLTCALT